MPRRSYAGNSQPTTLSAPMTSVDTSLTVVSGVNYPDGTVAPAVLTIDAGQAGEEKVLYTTRTGNTFSGLTRGFDGTTAVAHSASASVRHSYSATDANDANLHVNTSAAVHGVAGALVGTTDTQTLTNKTLGAGTVLPATVVDTTSAQTVSSKTLTGLTLGDLGTALVATSQTTTSATYADLATVGPAVTVTVGPSGRVLVILSGNLSNSGGAANFLGFAVSGATTTAAADTNAIQTATSTAFQPYALSRVIAVTGLAAGSTTFTAKYRTVGGTATYLDRQIIVIPL